MISCPDIVQNLEKKCVEHFRYQITWQGGTNRPMPGQAIAAYSPNHLTPPEVIVRKVPFVGEWLQVPGYTGGVTMTDLSSGVVSPEDMGEPIPGGSVTLCRISNLQVFHTQYPISAADWLAQMDLRYFGGGAEVWDRQDTPFWAVEAKNTKVPTTDVFLPEEDRVAKLIRIPAPYGSCRTDTDRDVHAASHFRKRIWEFITRLPAGFLRMDEHGVGRSNIYLVRPGVLDTKTKVLRDDDLSPLERTVFVTRKATLMPDLDNDPEGRKWLEWSVSGAEPDRLPTWAKAGPAVAADRISY